MIRELQADIRSLREKQTQRIGDWVLGRDEAGRVVLTNAEGRVETLTPDPDPDNRGFLAAADPVFKASRRATTQHATTAGFQTFLSGWYDSMEECPSYWSWDTTVNSLTVPTRSRLIVEQSQLINPVLIGDRLHGNVLFVNGVRRKTGATLLYEDQAVDSYFAVHDTWQLDTEPGDVLTFGYYCSTSSISVLTADVDGIDTRVEVTLIMER